MQRATTLWYHDHTMGLTALNMAAGMAGLYIIRDPQGEEKQFKKWMPSDERQLHLVIADRMFFANGSINYPNQGFVPNVHPNWIPGYIGDTNVVNGKVWPYLEVRRAMYRIRMVNAANARTYNLTFQCAAAGDSNFTLPLAGPVLPFYLVRLQHCTRLLPRPLPSPLPQPCDPSSHFLPPRWIGSDGGYLARPVRSSSLLFAPGMLHNLLLNFNAAALACAPLSPPPSPPPPAPPSHSPPPCQIGSDGGYLAHLVRSSSLLFAPGTRHDLLLNFNAAPSACQDVILVNSAAIQPLPQPWDPPFQCSLPRDPSLPSPPLPIPLPIPIPQPGQIGSDGGYLARPVRSSSLLFAPGVRHDLLLDFNAAPSSCQDVILVNSASIPFPVGLPADSFTGVVMRFNISKLPRVKTSSFPKSLSQAPAREDFFFSQEPFGECVSLAVSV
ncbi:unnamed protein product [Closterium sp. Yama58-4]|nr:unnamed protein product [Closterium sp. Yama58-4]